MVALGDIHLSNVKIRNVSPWVIFRKANWCLWQNFSGSVGSLSTGTMNSNDIRK